MRSSPAGVTDSFESSPAMSTPSAVPESIVVRTALTSRSVSIWKASVVWFVDGFTTLSNMSVTVASAAIDCVSETMSVWPDRVSVPVRLDEALYVAPETSKSESNVTFTRPLEAVKTGFVTVNAIVYVTGSAFAV